MLFTYPGERRVVWFPTVALAPSAMGIVGFGLSIYAGIWRGMYPSAAMFLAGAAIGVASYRSAKVLGERVYVDSLWKSETCALAGCTIAVRGGPPPYDVGGRGLDMSIAPQVFWFATRAADVGRRVAETLAASSCDPRLELDESVAVNAPYESGLGRTLALGLLLILPTALAIAVMLQRNCMGPQ